MKSLFIALVALWQIGTGTAALADHAVAGLSKWRGFIVDRQCAESVREDADPVPFLRHHGKDCSLMPSCRRHGYSLYANGKWLDLDNKANPMIILTLKSSRRKSGFYGEVAGTLQGKVITVQKIAELEEPSQTQPGAEK